jgi:DNA polymerase-1
MTPEQLEMRLMPVVARMERRGINLDGPRLLADTDHYWAILEEIDDKICQKLGRVVDVDSNEDLANAIEAAGKSKGFRSTPGGRRSVAKDSLIGAIGDEELLGLLLLRGALATSLRTFLQPWSVQYNRHGRLFLRWNQFRNYTDTGARTGRLSSSPNLQNIPVEWEELRAQLERIKYAFWFELPSIRRYIIPDTGMVFVGADYQAQEMRLLAHFSEGVLLESVRANPRGDIHAIAAQIANITRRVAKTLGFAILYGAGVGRIAEQLNIPVSEANSIKTRYLTALPDIKKFQKAQTELGKTGGYVETLGGRKYYTDPTIKVINGRVIDYSYKLVNYKIQGSAADQTKQAMINYDDMDRGDLVLTVHDQLVVQEPIGQASTKIQQAMEASYQDILRYQVIADPEYGMNFGEMSAEPENISHFIGKS